MQPEITIGVADLMADGPALSRIPAEPGVYRLFHPARPVERIGGTDARGTLYIGKATRLPSRLRQMKRSFAAAGTGWEGRHVGAMRYNATLGALGRDFPLSALALDLYVHPGVKAAEEAETAMLTAYFREFGEVPPLNGTLKLYPGGELRDELR